MKTVKNPGDPVFGNRNHTFLIAKKSKKEIEMQNSNSQHLTETKKNPIQWETMENIGKKKNRQNQWMFDPGSSILTLGLCLTSGNGGGLATEWRSLMEKCGKSWINY